MYYQLIQYAAYNSCSLYVPKQFLKLNVIPWKEARLLNTCSPWVVKTIFEWILT